ncbi:geranylgeranyl transferase type-2 subunit alpha [Cimex lectularius]|uniref:Geranylgeranyl transferase type-2 subunit alpha n=1 Tax=Cimex lectularius TaxID=79782 RepID=A0A8I6RNF6_CIMLE|nr:geranylgeranyl transferase type-2 subunit alpha [Cimex lectularius]
MHGMAKIKASEAEKEKKRKEKEDKARQYMESMKKILEKREKSEMDDEALTLMSDILVEHPDVYTLWNFRKEILLTYKDNKSEEELTPLVTSEMRLTEICLRANPKSYNAWYHRLWLLNHLPKADLETELMICNKYLKLDSRNFHCWDYRREVVSKLAIPESEELTYTLAKIEENFSNYSSWHYRSKLLPLVYKDPTGIRPIKEEIHVQELELVQNAAFTDPTDSSAWFYLRWLLGRLEPKLTVVSCYIKNKNIYLALSKCLTSDDNYAIEVEGQSLKEFFLDKTARLWMGVLPSNLPSELKIVFIINETKEEIILNKENNFAYFVKPQFEAYVGKKLLSVLNEQLDSCNQLLELEPESKWTLLTSVVLMEAIDKAKYNDVILNRIELLSKVDSLRRNYYFDTRSKFLIEMKLENWEPNENIDLSKLNLSALYHSQYLSYAVNVDLSGNNLEEKSLPLLSCLVNCEVLSLRGNRLKSLKGFPYLKSLKKLDLSNNKFDEESKLFPYLSKLEMLKELNICNNTFVNEAKDIDFKIAGVSVIYKT